MHIIFATSSSGTLNEARKAHTGVLKTYPNIKLSLFSMEESLHAEQWSRFEHACSSANVFIYDPHGADNEVMERMVDICKAYECDQLSLMINGAKWEEFIRFGPLDGSDIQLEPRSGQLAISDKNNDDVDQQKLRKQALEDYEQIKRYWHASSIPNWQELIYFVANLYGEAGVPLAKAPSYHDKTGIIDPETNIYYDSVDLFLHECGEDPFKPKIVFFYLASQARIKTVDMIRELKERLKPFATVIPIGFSSIMKLDVEELDRIFTEMTDKIELIVNFIGFRLGIGPKEKVEQMSQSGWRN